MKAHFSQFFRIDAGSNDTHAGRFNRPHFRIAIHCLQFRFLFGKNAKSPTVVSRIVFQIESSLLLLLVLQSDSSEFFLEHNDISELRNDILHKL